MTRNALTLAFLLFTHILLQSQTTPVLMGITTRGGNANTGTLFSLSPDGQDYKLRHHFDPVGPHALRAGLTLGSDGLLYGASLRGGSSESGSIFRLNPDQGSFEPLHYFAESDGSEPHSAPIEGADGKLYGTTAAGGNHSAGVIYRMEKNGSNFTVLHHFSGTDGAQPQGILHEASDGRLYGMTIRGGTHEDGTIYRIEKDGTGFVSLHAFLGFTEGRNPLGGLIEDQEGVLYGNLSAGGPGLAGTVFKIQKDGTGFELLKTFNFSTDDGNQPFGTLLLASDGKLYGTTFSGGLSYVGIIFRMDRTGENYEILHEFTAPEGRNPFAGNQLTEGSNGALFGTTNRGGTFENGAVYKINKNGADFAVIHHFSNEGKQPWSGVIAANGKIFGTTSLGGNSNGGIVFSIREDGTSFELLRDLSRTNEDGFAPSAALVRAQDGHYYGTTEAGGDFGFGTIFRLQPDGSSLETVYHFDGLSGGLPQSELLAGTDGLLYGTASQMGAFSNGTIYKFDPLAGDFTLLHTFSLVGEFGASPQAGLIEGSDGKLYGTARSGGSTGAGTVFRLNKNGTGMEAIYHFIATATTGNTPAFTLLEGDNGMLSGVTIFGGGATGQPSGTLFRLEKNGSNFSVLKNFDLNENGSPAGSLVSPGDGFLYGMTINGGDNLVGTIYRIAADGQTFETIHHLNVINGISPQGALLPDPAGEWLYGLAKSGGEFDQGVVFRLQTDGSQFEKIHDFEGVINYDGSSPNGGMVWVAQPSANHEKQPLTGLTVSPNPTNGPLHLSWSNAFPAGEKATLTVADATGKQLVKLKGNVRELDVLLSNRSQSWTPGIYFLRIETKQGFFSEKIIRQ